MTYQQTLKSKLAEFDSFMDSRKAFDPYHRDVTKNFLTSFAEKIAQSVREETIGEMVEKDECMVGPQETDI